MPRKVRRRRIGWSGDVFSGYRFLSDDDNSKFADLETAVRTYEKMYRVDAQLRSLITIATAPIVTAEWFFEEEDEIADFLRKTLLEGELRFKKFLREAVKHLYLGMTLFEKVYSEGDGRRLFISGLHWIHPKSLFGFEVDEVDQVVAILQKNKIGAGISGPYIRIPREKLVVFTYDQTGDNPQGMSAFRPAYKAYYFKEEVSRILGIHIDKWGAGIGRVTMGPRLRRNEAIRRGLDIVKNIRSHEYAGVVDIEGESKTEMLQPPGSSMIDGMLDTLRYFDNDEAKCLLAQFANAGQGQVSNRETAELLAELFIMYIHSVAKYMEEVINEEIVREVVELNFNSVEDFPRLKVRNLMAGFRIDRIMQALSQLVTMGAISKGPKLEEYSRSLVDIPPEVDLPEEDQASQGDTPVDQVDQQATDQQATDQQGGDNVEGQ